MFFEIVLKLVDSPTCAEVCNMGCPVADADHEESHEQLLQKWRRLHPGEMPIVT